MRRLTDALRPEDGESAARIDVRETYRTQLSGSIGGWQGMLIAALPPIVFVLVNTISRLTPAVIAAVATAVALAAFRLIRRQSAQQAVSGLFGVLIAALIAARTGQARGYFLFGIWQSFVYAVPFAVSVLVRRPLVGVIWEFLDPTPGAEDSHTPWHKRRVLRTAYTVATLVVTVIFLARGVVQAALYGENSTGWLAFARIAMGYPLSIVALGAGYWVVRRARTRLAAEVAVEPAVQTAAQTSDEPSADDGAAQR